MVTGATRTTVVTLSNKADAPAVSRHIMMSTRSGRPFPSLAAITASQVNTPVWRIVLAMIIMPINRKITFQSTDSNACSCESTPDRMINIAPASAAIVLCNRSVAITAYVSRKIVPAMKVRVTDTTSSIRFRQLNCYQPRPSTSPTIARGLSLPRVGHRHPKLAER